MSRKLIGSGTYGKVYSINVAVAIKSVESNSKGIAVIEPYIMCNIRHKNLAKCTEIVCYDNCIEIYQELAVCDLRQFYKNNLVTDTNYNLWKTQVIEAINCLHQNSIIHSDIKAHNVLIFKDNNVKLTDFSLSVIKEYKEVVIGDWTNGRVDDGLCTLTHQPPELWLNKEWNNKVDIWSYGCLLFEMKNRDFLFTGESVKEVYSFFHHRQELLKKRKLENAVIDELMLSCLKVEPNDRPSAFSMCSENNTVKTYTPRETTFKHLEKYLIKHNLSDPEKLIVVKIYEQLPKKNINLAIILAKKFLNRDVCNQSRSILVAERNLVKNGFKIIL